MHPTNLRRKSANAAATAEQRHITYHKVSQSHLPTPAGAERKQRGGSGGGGELTAVGGGGYRRNKKGPRTISLPLPPSTTLTS